MSVLFPHPLGPTTETNSPGAMSTVTGRNASNAPNTLLTRSISSRTSRLSIEAVLVTCRSFSDVRFASTQRARPQRRFRRQIVIGVVFGRGNVGRQDADGRQ